MMHLPGHFSVNPVKIVIQCYISRGIVYLCKSSVFISKLRTYPVIQTLDAGPMLSGANTSWKWKIKALGNLNANKLFY